MEDGIQIDDAETGWTRLQDEFPAARVFGPPRRDCGEQTVACCHPTEMSASVWVDQASSVALVAASYFAASCACGETGEPPRFHVRRLTSVPGR